jgi:hypothetical protein
MKKKYEQHGLGFVEALGLLFIMLKLTGVITWSWLWVLCPLWISAAIVIVIGLAIFILSKVGK